MSDENYTRITLRIPKELHQRLADAADATSRSTNAEIIARLQASFEYEEKTHSSLDAVMARLAAIEEAIKQSGGR
jgi:predicted transcriptional regulator